MATLTRDQILTASDLPSELVTVPEWGGDVFVKTMTGTDRDAFEQSIVETKGKVSKTNLANIRAKLAVRCVVDEKGDRLFEDKDAEALGKRNAAALDRIFGVAQKLNGMSKKDVEELAGN